MLNGLRKQLLPMLETLEEALGAYLGGESSLKGEIRVFLQVIQGLLGAEAPEIQPAAQALTEALDLSRPDLSRSDLSRSGLSSQEHSGAISSQALPAVPTLAQSEPAGPHPLEAAFDRYVEEITALPVQYKAVFLPYYDNTWDSLASVYEAFREDARFVTQVVILPILRNNVAGRQELVYRDYLTPLGIPNLPYQQYDFAAEQPDFVFYNNPYDGANISKFHSHIIKPHAGCMVYIPYFLYQHNYLGEAELAAHGATFTQLPGHNNCDVFVVQGESFLDTFRGFAPNGEKMVCLGNPKTDAIVRAARQRAVAPPPPPPEWAPALAGRIPLLLNTHYRFANREEEGHGAEYLLDFVAAHPDYALIWRPHPQSFIISFGPHFARMLEKAKEAENILLDTSPAVLPALMQAKAVFSHYSSITSEAVCADLPVFLLAPSNLEQRREEYLLGVTHSIRTERCGPDWNQLVQQEIQGFLEGIARGEDPFGDARRRFRQKLFDRPDGNCGRRIRDWLAETRLAD